MADRGVKITLYALKKEGNPAEVDSYSPTVCFASFVSVMSTWEHCFHSGWENREKKGAIFILDRFRVFAFQSELLWQK